MITIDWQHLGMVAGASIFGSALVVALFSLGIRLLVSANGAKAKAEKGDMQALRSEAANRAGAYALLALSAGAVVYGILLIIPNLIPSV